MLFSKKTSGLVIVFCMGTAGLFAASSPLSLPRIILPQVMLRLIALQRGKDRIAVYDILSKAEKIKGIEPTAHFLESKILEAAAQRIEDPVAPMDWIGYAIQSIALGALQVAVRMKNAGDDGKADGLIRELKDAYTALFDAIQPSLNDNYESPRGSSGDYTPRRKHEHIPSGLRYRGSDSDDSANDAKAKDKAEDKENRFQDQLKKLRMARGA